MAFENQDRREVDVADLGRWGRVVPATGSVGWQVVDPQGAVVESIAVFLREFAAAGNRPGSVRSYAFVLLRWWRWLRTVEVAWDQATSAEVRDFVLWLGRASKPRRAPRTVSAATVGRVNAVTGKAYLSDQYAPRTVRHSNAVVRAFYEFWIERGQGPLVNPVALARGRSRAHAHHNPLEPFGAEGRLRYNPKIAKRRPRAISDQRWDELFAALRFDRDRAITAVAVSTGARAGELLGMRPVDLDWGEQLVRVVRKGTRAEAWLPASSEAFVWLRLYLAGRGTVDPDEPLWWTLDGRGPAPRGVGRVAGDGPPPRGSDPTLLAAGGRRPLTYPALRAVLVRANRALGTNYSWHDLRHTAALRMSRDESLSMRDVQTVLGHANLSTTADVYLVEDEATVLARVHQHHLDRAQQALAPAPLAAAGYDAADLSVLLGGHW